MSTDDEICRMVQTRTLRHPGEELAARALTDADRLETDPQVKRLADILRDSGEWKERVEAWDRLREMGPSVRGWERTLVDLIYCADGWGRIFAAESLAWNACSEDHAVPVLLATLTSTMELRRYDWSRLACGAIGKYPSLPRPLTDQTVPAMIRALHVADHDVRGYAAMALGNWKTRSSPALVELADLYDTAPDYLRDHYLQVMRQIDPSITSARDARVRSLDSEDALVRAKAVNSLGLSNGPEELSNLLSLFQDESVQVRRNLAVVLGKVGIRSDEILIKLRNLAEDEDPSVRLAANYAFARVNDSSGECLKNLRRTLESDADLLRLQAAQFLGEVGGKSPWRTASALKKALRREKNESVRQVIEKALEQLEKS